MEARPWMTNKNKGRRNREEWNFPIPPPHLPHYIWAKGKKRGKHLEWIRSKFLLGLVWTLDTNKIWFGASNSLKMDVWLFSPVLPISFLVLERSLQMLQSLEDCVKPEDCASRYSKLLQAGFVNLIDHQEHHGKLLYLSTIIIFIVPLPDFHIFTSIIYFTIFPHLSPRKESKARMNYWQD